MTPEAILLTIRAGFEFGTELLRYLQTDKGQEFAAQVLNDRAAWDKFWLDAGGGLKRLFTGDLFKPQPEKK
jgi:hypothetical protein